uniref:Prolyl 3-hydroxylase 1 n=1 Tax=Cyanistes caeruleus TaxID=156563 RepID=A0A8C0V450_CYACU
MRTEGHQRWEARLYPAKTPAMAKHSDNAGPRGFRFCRCPHSSPPRSTNSIHIRPRPQGQNSAPSGPQPSHVACGGSKAIMNRPAQAAAAAHTFFVANPGHQEMRQNLEYYQAMVGVHEDDFTDLEAKPHLREFQLGVRFYTEEQPAAAILHLEKALEEYLVADAECRALCEGPYDYEGYNYLEYNADLFQAITDHSMQVLSCKQGCVTELASQPGQEKPLEDFLPSHFNYLQFAYYNNGNYEKAIECAKTYLLFFPHDEVMNQNLAYYTAVLGEHLARPIQPREEIQVYHQRSLMEKELLFFSYDVFGIPFVDPDTWTPEEVIPKRLREKQKVERETAARISEEIGNLMKEIETLVEEKAKESADMSKFIREGGPLVYEGASVTMNSKALNGSQRVVVDGVLSAEECQALQRLTNAAASAGDGYRGKTSPHTPSETFYGVTVLKALKLGQEGKVPLHSAYLYYNVTEKVRRMMESYFRLEVPLHFSYSHLVCRTAIEEKQEGRSDNSHEVHVDNCILNAEALVCVKEPPAYTFRDYRYSHPLASTLPLHSLPSLQILLPSLLRSRFPSGSRRCGSSSPSCIPRGDGRWGPAAGRVPGGCGRLAGSAGRGRAAALEAELVCWRRHHHGRGAPRGAVDELRCPEHRAGPVPPARLAALPRRWVRGHRGFLVPPPHLCLGSELPWDPELSLPRSNSEPDVGLMLPRNALSPSLCLNPHPQQLCSLSMSGCLLPLWS